jgi:predicted NUDIX family phosphoesterase
MKELVIDLISDEALSLKERILVVRSRAIPNKEGVLPESAEQIFAFISKHGLYKLRNNSLEANTSFRQVIPYFVVKAGGRFLYSSRSKRGSEKRLRGKGLIGFGGHVRADDVEGKELLSWGRREIREELDLAGQEPRLSFKGLINDQSEPVSLVHLGLLIVAEIAQPKAELLEKDKFNPPEWLTLGELKRRASLMEGWSQLVLKSGLI